MSEVDDFASAQIVLPEIGSTQRVMLKQALIQSIPMFLEEQGPRFLTLRNHPAHDSHGPMLDPLSSNDHYTLEALIETDDPYVLAQLVYHIRLIRPLLWRKRIWPLVRPRHLLPSKNDMFFGRYREQAQILEELSGKTHPVVHIRGINGIGKSALALEVARLCKQQGIFNDIFWISIQSDKLLYVDEVHDWADLLGDLNLALGWQIPPTGDANTAHEAFIAQCENKLKSGLYLLCIDGLDNPQAHPELVAFLRQLTEANCKAIVTTTSDFEIQNALVIELGRMSAIHGIDWLYQLGLEWNIPHLKYAQMDDMQTIFNSMGGIPLALHWRAAQMATNHVNESALPNLQGMSTNDLLSNIFETSFNSLDDTCKHLLLTLALFDWPITAATWAGAANIAPRQLTSCTQRLRRLLLVEHDRTEMPATLNDQQAEQRYGLLTITRSFVVQHLEKDPALKQQLLWNRVHYYRRFCRRNGGNNRRAYDLIIDDWANIWQVIQEVIYQWQVTSQQPLTKEAKDWGLALISFANMLSTFSRVRGLWLERRELCQSAAIAADKLMLPEHLGPLAYQVGWIYCSYRDLAAAKLWAKWALDRLQSLHKGTGYALRLFARIELYATENHPHQLPLAYPQIQIYLQRAQEAFELDHDQAGLARVESDKGNVAFKYKLYGEALLHHQQALRRFEDIDDWEGVPASYINLGDIHLEEMRYDQAHHAYSEALQLARQMGITEIVAEAEKGLAKTALRESATITPYYRLSHLLQARNQARSAQALFFALSVQSDASQIEQLVGEIEQALQEAKDVELVPPETDDLTLDRGPTTSTMTEQYTDFKLRISADGSITAESGAGERTSISKAPLKLPSYMKMMLEFIEQDVAHEELLIEFGIELYQLIFKDKIDVHFNKTEAAAQARNQNIRIRLAIQPDILATLPWEFIFREEIGHFLSTNPKTVLSYYLESPTPPAPIRRREGPLHLLVIVAHPNDQVSIDVDAWERRMQQVLAEPKDKGWLTMTIVKNATIPEISKAIRDQPPDIVQFIGHGVYCDGKGALALVDHITGGTKLVHDASFADLFLEAMDRLGLVCLATCESARSESLYSFLGIAPQIMQRGVPAVIAMRYPIPILTAEIFFRYLYEAVAERKPIDWAVQSARNKIKLELQQVTRDFAAPVLYMRAPNGYIF